MTGPAAADHRTLDLPCRYYRVYTDLDVPCEERTFGFVERTLPLPAARTALVLVDVWATHYIDSWLERAGRVTRERIVPLLEAVRQAGVTVIHAPSPWIVERHHREAMPPALPPGPPATWPPASFRGIFRSGASCTCSTPGSPPTGASSAGTTASSP